MKKVRLIVSCLLLLLALGMEAREMVVLFGSDDCDDCQEFKQQWQARFPDGDADSPVLVYVCIDDDDNYVFLQKLEQELKVEKPVESFPVLLVGRHFLNGIEAFYAVPPDTMGAWLVEKPQTPLAAGLVLAAEQAEQSLVSWDAATESAATPEKIETVVEGTGENLDQDQALVPGRISLLFLENKACEKCNRQRREFQLLEKKLPEFNLQAYLVSTPEGQIQLERVRQKFGLTETTENLAPMVVWSNGYSYGKFLTAEEILENLRQVPADVTPFWLEDISEAERQNWQHRLQGFTAKATVWVVALAGLLDGLNPCAFATSIFLIGYLLYLKRRARDIVLVGGAFCLGVFLTYLLFGLGLSYVIDALNSLNWLKMLIYLTFAAVSLCLAALNIKDAIAYKRTGKTSDLVLGLSTETHNRIHGKIKWLTTSRTVWLMVPAASLLGVIVSSMEMACTGQIYLPTLAAINSAGLNFRAVCLLVLYNIFFIIPLIVISALAAAGFGLNAVNKWARKHLGGTKIAMALIFLAITAVMIAMALAQW